MPGYGETVTGTLAAEDAAAVLDAVEDLSGATGQDDLVARILCRTAELIPNDSCSFNWMALGSVSALVRPRIDPVVFDRLNRIIARHWAENPLADHFRRTGDTRALTWTDVEGDQRWRSGRLYQDFYTPLGVTHQLAVRLPSPPGVVAGLVCNRSTAFDRRDRHLLTAFGRQVVAQLGSVTERAALRAAFDQRGWRTILVDDDARIAGAGGDCGLPISRGPVLVPALARLVQTQARRAGDGELIPGEPEEVRLAAGRFVAFVVPSSIPPHLLFVRALETVAREPVGVTALHGLGMSPRQAEVAARLASGRTNKQIAGELCVTVGTVKKHLQAVFAILGVQTRAAAAASVVRMQVERSTGALGGL